jgi:hypothetical protein
MRILIAISLFLSVALYGEEYCYFIPPSEWEAMHPSLLKGCTEIGFIGKGDGDLLPSVNLAIEEGVNIPLAAYVAAVKKIHEANPNKKWRDLGKTTLPGGVAELTEIEEKIPQGDLRMFQLLLLRKGAAYIITASALKEEFPKFSQAFQKSLRSITFTSDLFGEIRAPEKKEKLRRLHHELLESAAKTHLDEEFHNDHWLPFQNLVTSDFTDLGPHWQFLVLKQAQHETELVPVKIDEVETETLVDKSLDTVK